MDSIEWAGVLAPVAYLLGTFPSAGVVARSRGIDILTAGSGNPGASNAFRLFGWKVGLAVLVLDVGKGTAAGAIGQAVDGNRGAYILGLAAVLGHMFPVTRRFRGGRGVATAAGVMIVLFPVVILVLAAVWFAIARGLHKASVASLVCAVAFPAIVAVRGDPVLDVTVASLVAALVVVRHAANLRRLVRGEEHGLGGAGRGGVAA